MGKAGKRHQACETASRGCTTIERRWEANQASPSRPRSCTGGQQEPGTLPDQHQPQGWNTVESFEHKAAAGPLTACASPGSCMTAPPAGRRALQTRPAAWRRRPARWCTPSGGVCSGGLVGSRSGVGYLLAGSCRPRSGIPRSCEPSFRELVMLARCGAPDL